MYLRTDDPDYLEQMKSVFAAHSAFVECDTPGDLAEMTTDFEREFIAAGKSVWRLAYEYRSDVDDRTTAVVTSVPTPGPTPTAPNDFTASPPGKKIDTK